MFDALRIFVAVADRGSFAAASRALAVVPSTISKRITALEEHFGAQLVRRTTRRLALTDEGVLVLEAAREILARHDALAAALGQRIDQPAGTLRITTTPWFGQLVLARLLPAFHRQWPAIDIELILTDRAVDLVAEKIDLAIRFGDLPDSDLRCRRLGANIYRLCASPAYLAEHGRPAHPRALAGHACLTDRSYPPLRTWRLQFEGEAVVIEPRGPLQTDDPVVRHAATLGGMGIAALPAYVIREAVTRGELEVLFEESPLRIGGIWALHAATGRTPARVAAFLDFAVAAFAAAEIGAGG
ncbi:MAG: LysR family transcriptional regulator [bacterium]